MKGRIIVTAVFSVLVLSSYAVANVMALDPFAASSDTRELPPDMTTDHRSGGAIFWYGGFSGGK